MGNQLKNGERIDQLATSGIRIIQSEDVFSFSLDAVLLATFPRLPQKGEIVDMCSGNGAVGLFVSQKTRAKITLIELQQRLVDMAVRSIALNNLSDRVSVIQTNLKETSQYLGSSKTDLILCNPPYFKTTSSSVLNENQHYSLARHELTTNLEEIARAAQQTLKPGGHFAMVHRPERFFEIMETLKAHHLIPKKIQFVYPKANQSANILLVDAIKDGAAGGELFLPPLIVHEESGDYTTAIKKIYYGDEKSNGV